MRVLITGFPGTGKSTIAACLKAKGYKAVDLELMDGYMQLLSRETGEVIDFPKDPPRGWFDTVGRFDFVLPKVKELIAAQPDIILCTHADNQEEIFDLFDTIIVLTIDDETLRHRLTNRTNNSFGKNPNSLADTLELHAAFENRMLSLGAVKIDVSRPLEEVIESILNEIN